MKPISSLLSAIAALILSAGIVSAPASAAAQETKPVQVEDALMPCVNQAVAQGIQQWTCTAEGLYVQRDATGKVKHDSKGKVALDFHEMKAPGYQKVTERLSPAEAERLLAPKSAAALADEYDTWCDYGSICPRLVNDYIFETKGNAAYGDQNGAIGAYDIILRTNLNGRQANNTLHIYHDSGPSLGFADTWLNCFEMRPFSTSLSCGEVPLLPFTVTASSRHYTSGLKYGNYLANANQYMTTVSYSFLPAGYNMYIPPSLYNPEFTCPTSGNCKYN